MARTKAKFVVITVFDVNNSTQEEFDTLEEANTYCTEALHAQGSEPCCFYVIHGHALTATINRNPTVTIGAAPTQQPVHTPKRKYNKRKDAAAKSEPAKGANGAGEKKEEQRQ